MICTAIQILGYKFNGGRFGAVRCQRSLWGLWGTRANAVTAIHPYVSYNGAAHLKKLIYFLENAVDPQNFEPNLALNLEISDLINSKKGNAWAEAPWRIKSLINIIADPAKLP